MQSFFFLCKVLRLPLPYRATKDFTMCEDISCLIHLFAMLSKHVWTN